MWQVEGIMAVGNIKQYGVEEEEDIYSTRVKGIGVSVKII